MPAFGQQAPGLKISLMFYISLHFVGCDIDFHSPPQTVTIFAGTNSSTINIIVTNDNIVEGNETISMSLTVPLSLGPGITTGAIASATVTIIDTSSELCVSLLCSCIIMMILQTSK